MSRSKNIGAELKGARGIDPQSIAGNQTINGPAINRQAGSSNFYSGKLQVATGASSGAPSSYSVAAKIQHSADGSTGWADYTDPITGATAAITALTADNSVATADVDLENANQYLRVVLTTAFTGGTSPAVLASAGFTLGGPDILPAS